jgi:hypothetical protein
MIKLLKCNITDIGKEEIEKRFSCLPENLKEYILKKNLDQIR